MSELGFRTALDDSKKHTGEELEAANNYLRNSKTDIVLPGDREDDRVNVRIDDLAEEPYRAADYFIEIGSKDKPLRFRQPGVESFHSRIYNRDEGELSLVEVVEGDVYEIVLRSQPRSYTEISAPL